MATNRKNNKDYNNGKIYCIRNMIDDDIYVGSTTQPLSKRMVWHRQTLLRDDRNNTMLYQKMKQHGIDTFYIELLVEHPCDNLEQLRQKEGEYIRNVGNLNMYIAGRSEK